MDSNLSLGEQLNSNSGHAVLDPSDQDDPRESSCGLGGWYPDWLQPLASKKSYVLVFGTIGTMMSATGAYYVATISTIEKRFKMPSTTSGLIASSWDVGALCGAMILAYFGSSGHKTRWVASGALVAGLSCYLRYIPHAVFGPGQDALDYQARKGTNNSEALCVAEAAAEEENCSLESDATFSFLILVLAHVGLGVGTSAYDTLGIAYMDDNTLKNKVPVILAICTSIRMMGPSAGFLIASYALHHYIEPSIEPPFGRDDPRWIGAWWLGWIPIGTAQITIALVMLLFPRTLPREAARRREAAAPTSLRKEKSLKDFVATMMRLARNPLLMFNSFSSTFYMFAMTGYYIFMPKYMETQFRLSASEASLVTGSVGLVCTAVGVVVSGVIVSKFRPRPRYLAAWNVFTESLDVLGHVAFAFLGCPKDDLSGGFDENGKWDLILDCNAGCNCSSSIKYSPVCSLDKTTTFYSPCHGGCTLSTVENGTKVYDNCSCIPEFKKATDGACAVDCGEQFLIFLVLLCIMRFLSATGRSGNTLIQFRSVLPEDKSISIALTEVLACALAFIPAPIIFGALLDSSCLVWGVTCGVTGNCWLYNGQVFRFYLNFTASGLLLVATILDVGVLYSVGSLKIYDEDFAQEEEEEEGKKPEGLAQPSTFPLLLRDVD